MVTFIDTQLASGVSITPAGWRDMGGLPIQMAEYNTRDAAGQPVDLSQRKTQFTADGKTVTSKAVLTEAEAATYTIQNVLSGADQWQADQQGRILDAPVLAVSGQTLSWTDPTGQAACFLLTIDGQCHILTGNAMTFDGGLGPVAVSVQSVSEQGVLGHAATTAAPTPPTAVFGFAEDATPSPTYSLSGTRLPSERKGINITKGKKFYKK
jgi:hypothetical protein